LEQGDQIGRIFAKWAIVYFGYIFKNFSSNPDFRAASFHCKIYLLILTKQWVWLHFGQFFTHSSGRAVLEVVLHSKVKARIDKMCTSMFVRWNGSLGQRFLAKPAGLSVL
jgi:hypothetical protein